MQKEGKLNEERGKVKCRKREIKMQKEGKLNEESGKEEYRKRKGE